MKFDLKTLTHNTLDIAIDSYTQNRIEIRSPSPSKIQPPLSKGSGVRHIRPENMSIQQGYVARPRMELTDGRLFFDPELDLDAMDFETNTARVEGQALRFNVTDTPSTMLDMSSVLPGHSQQISPFHCRYPPTPRDPTYLVSSPTFRSAIGWQETSSSCFYNSPGRRPFLEDKHSVDSLVIQKFSPSFLTLELAVACFLIARSICRN
jgi:hypothetical protein